jgi:ubiquinone biosynthesis monooxygenase Coq6
MVKAQEYFMKNFLFNETQKRAFEETQVNMGASIENNHLLAALTERTKLSGKCEII